MSDAVQQRNPIADALKTLDWRGVVVVAAAVAVAIELPVWVRAPLSVAAAVCAITYCVSRRTAREPVDTVLRSVGAVAVVLVLLGLVLNLLPTGLTAQGWGIAVGIIELAAMVGFAVRAASVGADTPPVASDAGVSDAPSARVGARRVLGFVVWGVLAAGVLTGALLLSLNSYDRTHIAPIALGAETTRGTTVVTIESGRSAGPLDLRLVDADGETTVLKSGIRVGPDEAATSVRVPASTVGRLELSEEGSSRALRSLILDGTVSKGNG